MPLVENSRVPLVRLPRTSGIANESLNVPSVAKFRLTLKAFFVLSAKETSGADNPAEIFLTERIH